MTEQMTVRGTLKGHTGWVTQIATTPQFPDMILSASRGEHFHRSLALYANVSVLALTGGLGFADFCVPREAPELLVLRAFVTTDP